MHKPEPASQPNSTEPMENDETKGHYTMIFSVQFYLVLLPPYLAQH